MATIQDLGKVAYLNKGVYNSETTYEINDVVSFNGSSYVSKTNENRGNLPTNTIYWSIVASKGDKGETGKPFVIEKTYMTIEAMVADYDNMNINDYVMISGNIEEEQNATLWTKTANEVSPYKWEYLADFSGASGITGATPNIIIGNVTEGNQPAVTRRAGSSNENPILDFILKTGPKGDIGDTGNGISSIEKTGTSGLVDTYTITYTNGNTTTFTVANGKGISSISKTSTVGLVDTYRITYNDGTTFDYTVTNGEDADITPEEFEDLQNEVDELKDENARLKATLPTTKETGENITLDKTAELDFVVPPLPIGNTKQNTTEGTQRIDTNETINETTSNGVTYSLKNGVFKFNGTATTGFYVTLTNKVNLESGTYTFAPVDESGSYTGTMGKYGYTNTDVLEGGQTKAVIVRTLNENYSDVVLRFFIANGCVFNNYQFKINLVKGTYTSSTIPAWEPYTNGASPNLSYPQEVQVVKGDVEVDISGRNKYNKDDNNSIIEGYFDGTVFRTSPVGRIAFIKCAPETTYTISKVKDQRFAVATTRENPNNGIDHSIYGSITNNYGTTITITTEEQAKYLLVFYYFSGASLKTEEEIRNSIQIELGENANTYSEYQGRALLPLYLPVENLCPTKSFNSISTARIVSNVTGGGSVPGISVKAGTYTASFDVTTLPSIDYRMQLVASSDSTQIQSGSNLTNQIKTETISCTSLGRYKITISVTESCYLYLRCVPYGFVLDNIQIEPGSKANHYTPFGTTPIELCKIGDYKDYFYKSGSKWYLHKEIGKVVLNGTETWTLRNQGDGSTTISFTHNISNLSGYSNIICTHFIHDNFSSNGVEGIGVSSALTDIFLEIKRSRLSSLDVAGLKDWLSNNNMAIYYIATAPDIEITDTTIINQLEAINNAISYEGQTNISGTSSGINPLFDVEAYQSTKLLLENALNRLELLEN